MLPNHIVMNITNLNVTCSARSWPSHSTALYCCRCATFPSAMASMKSVVAIFALALSPLQGAAVSVRGGQDPCSGCDEGLAQAYQTCASVHGNPCAERGSDGLVGSGPGTKKDMSCCLKKNKHDRCLNCKSMDCSFKTCNVNKQYYSERKLSEKLDDKKAMKNAGWGN